MFDPNHEDIKRARRDVDQRRAECEKARETFLKELGSALEAWIPEVIRTYVTVDQRAHTATLTADQAKAMKADLAGIVASVQKRLLEWLGADELWEHRAKFDGTMFVSRRGSKYTAREDANHAPETIDKPLRRGVSALLYALLERYGYKTVDTSGRKTHGGDFSFKGKPNNALTSYGVTVDALQRAEQMLAQTIEKLEIEAATAVWDGDDKK